MVSAWTRAVSAWARAARVEPYPKTDHHHHPGGDQCPAQQADVARAAFAIALGGGRGGGQRRCLFDFLAESELACHLQRCAALPLGDPECAAVQGVAGRFQRRPHEQPACGAKARPQFLGLLATADRAAVVLVGFSLLAALGCAQMLASTVEQGRGLAVAQVFSQAVGEAGDVAQALRRVAGHRRQRQGDQFVGQGPAGDAALGRVDDATFGAGQHGAHVSDRSLLAVGRSKGEDLVEDGAEQVNVAPWTERLAIAACQFGGHVGRGADDHPRGLRQRDERVRRFVAKRNGAAPVHHQHLTEAADHDVLGLEVAVEDAPGVGEAHRVADLEQDFEVLVELPLGDLGAVGLGFGMQQALPGRAFDQLHHQPRQTLLADEQIVYRHDVGMFQQCRRRGLGPEAAAGYIAIK